MLGTAYRPNFKSWALGTGQQKKLGTNGYRVPAKKKLLGTDGYRVPAKKKFWVPMGTGYRENFHLCRPLLYVLKQNSDDERSQAKKLHH